MSAHSPQARRWWLHAAGFFVVAVTVHLLAVWAAPTVIMRVVGSKVASIAAGNTHASAQTVAHNGIIHAQQVTAQSRSVVMPSPDMLYSVCSFDLSQGPLHIAANPAISTYWSIALYAANSDNFYVINDRQAQGKPIDLKLVPRNSSEAGKPGVVVAPSDTGLLLMRVLTGNYEAEKAVLEPARRTLQCTPLKAPA